MEERSTVQEPMPFPTGPGKDGGRQPGVRNRTTRLLKEAILLAAELEGRDGEGKDGLIGFLRRVANADTGPLPCCWDGCCRCRSNQGRHAQRGVVYRSVAQVRVELEQSGYIRDGQADTPNDDDDHNVVKLDGNDRSLEFRLLYSVVVGPSKEFHVRAVLDQRKSTLGLGNPGRLCNRQFVTVKRAVPHVIVSVEVRRWQKEIAKIAAAA